MCVTWSRSFDLWVVASPPPALPLLTQRSNDRDAPAQALNWLELHTLLVDCHPDPLTFAKLQAPMFVLLGAKGSGKSTLLERLLMMAQTVEMISVSTSNSSRLRFLVP